MVEFFHISGILAGTLTTIAGLTGFFGPSLRKRIKGTAVLKLHRFCGIGAVAFGLMHGLIYVIYIG